MRLAITHRLCTRKIRKIYNTLQYFRHKIAHGEDLEITFHLKSPMIEATGQDSTNKNKIVRGNDLESSRVETLCSFAIDFIDNTLATTLNRTC